MSEKNQDITLLRQRLAQSNIIVDATRRFTSTLDSEEIQQTLFEAVFQVVGAQQIALHLISDQGAQSYVCHPMEGLRVETAVLPPAATAFHLCKEVEQVIWNRDGGQAAPPISVEAVKQFDSYLALPLKGADQVVGAIEAFNLLEPQNAAQQAVLLTEIAGPAGLAIYNGMLYQKAQHEIAERKRAEQEVRQQERMLAKRAAQLETVSRVSVYTSTILEPDKLLQEVVNLTKDQFELYHVHIYLVNEAGDQLALVVGAGEVGRQMVAQGRTIPLQQTQSLVAQVARSGQGFIENDVRSNPAFLPHPLLPDTHSEAAVPIVSRGRVLGVLDVQSDRKDTFTEQDIQIQTTLAAHIAAALENARSYEQTITSLVEIKALLDITKETSQVLEVAGVSDNVLDRVLAATNSDAGLITVFNPDTQKLEIRCHRLPEPFWNRLQENGLEGTLCDLVYRRRESIIVDIVANAPVDVSGLLSMDYKSYQGVPLESQGEVLGTLCLFSREPLPPGKANSVFLQAVGRQIGIAFRNMALLEQAQLALSEAEQSRQSTQEYLDMQHVLHELNIELFQINDPDELYRRAIELAHTRLGFERIGMFLLNESKDTLLGTYGVDTTGNMRSEQGPEHIITDPWTIETFILNRTRLTVEEDADLSQEGEVVGRGWHIGAAMWAEESPIGVIFADNLLTGQPLKPYQAELLFAYAGIVANLIKRHRVEETIRERETLLRTIIDSTPDWIFVKDREHRYRLVNQGYADSMHMALEAFIGKNDLDIGFPEEIVKGNPEKGIRGFWADDSEIMASGERKIIDEEPAVVDGEARVLHTVKVPLHDTDDEVFGLVGFVHDITDRKQIEITLHQSEEKFRSLFEQSADAYLILEDNLFVDCNQATVDLLRASSKEEVLALHPSQISPEMQPDGRQSGEKADEMIQVALEEGNHRFQWIHRCVDGEEFAAEVLLTPIQMSGKQAVFAVVRDVTDRKQAQETIAKRAAEIQAVAEVGTAAATILDTDELLQEVVDLTKDRFDLYHAHIYLLDKETETLVLTSGAGEGGRQMVAEGKQIPLKQEQSLVARAARSRQGVVINDVRSEPDFLPHPLLPHTRAEMAIPLITGEQVLGVLDVQSDRLNYFTKEDISTFTTLAAQTAVALQNARSFEQAQTAFRNAEQSEQFLTTLINTIPNPIFYKDTDGVYIGMNQAFLEMLGVRPEDLLGKSVFDLQTDQVLAQKYHDMDVALFENPGEPQVYESRVTDAAGQLRDVIFNKNVFYQADGKLGGLVGVMVDITGRKKAEAILRRSEADLSQALKTAKLAYWEYDVEKDLFTFNDQFYSLFHTTAEQHGGYQLSSAYYAQHFVHPDDLQVVGAAIEQSFTSTDRYYNRSLEHRIMFADGGVGYVLVNINVERDEHGNILRSYGANQDITERKIIEKALAKQSNELADLTRRLTREGWQDYLNQPVAKDMGYVFESTEVRPISQTAGGAASWLADGKGSQPVQPLVQPISIHGETIGQLAVLPDEEVDEIDAEMVEIVRSVTEQLQARIENLRLTDQTQIALAQTEEQAHRLRQLNEMSAILNQTISLSDIYQIAVDETSKIMGGDDTSLSLLTETKEYFEVVATSGATPGLLKGMRMPVAGTPLQQMLQEDDIVRSTAEGPLALSCHVPLIVSGDVIGALNLGYKEAQLFKAGDESLLRQIATLVSSNIETTRFLLNEQARAQREQIMRQITQRIRSSADVETIMRTAVQEIGRTLGRKTYIYLGEDHEV